jgi:hypothetical protein
MSFDSMITETLGNRRTAKGLPTLAVLRIRVSANPSAGPQRISAICVPESNSQGVEVKRFRRFAGAKAMIGVTFEIKYDSDYTNRYTRLYDVFKRFGILEARTTSCVFLNTDSAEQVHTALYGALDYTKDKAIVFTTYKHLMKTLGL